MQIALTLFAGVSADECEAFTMAFARLGDCQLIGVGSEASRRDGHVDGPGGRQRIDASFDEIRRPDVVLVPGGLGVDRTAHDEELLQWLRQVEPTCQWMAASSTGTVVVAAAGLLRDRPAATHWLAGPMLAEYGSDASPQRIVEVGHVLTCHGHISAMEVALLIVLRLYNRETAQRVRAEIADGESHRPVVALGWFDRVVRRQMPRRRPRNEQLIVSEWVEMELVEERPRQ